MFSGFTSYASLSAIQKGLTPAQAAGFLSCFSLASLGGRILTGTIDRLHIPKKLVSVVEYAGVALGCLVLANAASAAHFYAASVLCGFCAGIHATIFPLLIPEYFGNKAFSVLYGAFNTISNVGSTLTPLAVYAIATAAGGFRLPYMLIAAILALCVFVSAAMKPWRPAA